MEIIDGYIIVALDVESRAHLQKYVGDGHTNITAKHMTVVYKPSRDFFDRFFEGHTEGKALELEVHSIISNQKCVTAKIARDSFAGQLSTKQVPHITISTQEGTSNNYSNTLLSLPKSEVTTLEVNITLQGFIAFIQH